MQGQNIFSDEKEIRRLKIQNRLLSGLEKPLICRLFSGKNALSVLDVGCNNGAKTFELFSDAMFSRVIGLEHGEDLVTKANEKYGCGKFSFYKADIESPKLADKLAENCDIKQFDIIYISFVLMHLNDPEMLLKRLKGFLKPGGVLIAVETNDCASEIKPCGQELLDGAVKILENDKYAGKRGMGKILPELLIKCGYTDIETLCDFVSAAGMENEKKEDIFTTFFSYLPDDIKLLLSENPEDPEYAAFSDWIRENYEKLHLAVTDSKTEIKMGLKIIACKRRP